METGTNSFSLNVPETVKKRLIIVGGGFGGINLLSKLSRKDYQIVLIDRYNYHTFQPLLYQVATAGLEPDSVAEPLRKIAGRDPDVHFRMVKAERIDPTAGKLYTAAGDLKFDYLVVATGAQVNFFGNEHVAQYALPLKQITHALDLRSHIFQQFEKAVLIRDENERKRLMTFVVVGAGPTGVELCGALAELKNKSLPHDYSELNLSGMEIILIDGLDRVLPAMSAESGERARRYLENMGVKIILGQLISDCDGKTVSLKDGTVIRSGTLIWAAGVKGNFPDGFDNGSIRRNLLAVNRKNQIYRDAETGEVYRNIFAVGDAAQMETGKGSVFPGLAPVAIQQGKQLAQNLNRLAKNKPMKAFRYKNKGVLATIGRNKAVADLPGSIRLAGWPGWIIWLMVHLAYLIGFRNKTVVFANWVWSYFTYDRGIRLIIRPSTKSTDPLSREMIGEMKEDA